MKPAVLVVDPEQEEVKSKATVSTPQHDVARGLEAAAQPEAPTRETVTFANAPLEQFTQRKNAHKCTTKQMRREGNAQSRCDED